MMEDEGGAHIFHPLITKDALDQRHDNSGVNNANTEVHVWVDAQKVVVARTPPRVDQWKLDKVSLFGASFNVQTEA